MRIIILIGLTVFIYSCGRNTGDKKIDSIIKTKEIRLVSKSDSIITKISEIASDIEYIPLQPSARTRIRAIDKIITRGNKIYINLINDLLCFNDQGRFLYQLYGNGKEKEENVVAIYDFALDTGDTTLIVLYGNKLLQFKNTASGFGYIKTIKLGSISPSKLDFVPGTNKILLSSIRMKGYEPSFNILINLNKDKLSVKPYSFKRFNTIENRLWDEFIHYQFENKLYFKERFNDTVFSINFQSNNFAPTLIFGSRLTSTNSENINDPKYFRILPCIVNIFEVPRYLYYTYYFSGQSHQIFYDKYDSKKYELDTWNGFLKDNIAGGPDFDPEYCSEGKLYSWIGVRDLKRYIGGEDFAKTQVQNPKKKEALKKLADSLRGTDNPVLIVVTPRK
jgi:hypothetical protein